MELFFSPNSGEDQKEKASPKMEHFFSPNSSGHLRSDAHQSQIIGENADVDHTQAIGGDTVKLLGRCIPHSPPGFGTPAIIWMPGPLTRKLAHYIILCTLWCKEQVWLTFDFDF